MALGRLASTTVGHARAGTKASRQRVLSRKAAENLLRLLKSYARQVQFVNLTLDENEACENEACENEAANAVVGGLKRGRAQLFGWAFGFLWVLR